MVKQRVPGPAAQSRIDALNAELDGLRHQRERTIDALQEEVDALNAQMLALRSERNAIYRTCERVEVDR